MFGDVADEDEEQEAEDEQLQRAIRNSIRESARGAVSGGDDSDSDSEAEGRGGKRKRGRPARGAATSSSSSAGSGSAVKAVKTNSSSSSSSSNVQSTSSAVGAPRGRGRPRKIAPVATLEETTAEQTHHDVPPPHALALLSRIQIISSEHAHGVTLQSSAEDSTDMFLNAANHSASAAIVHNTDENDDGELEHMLDAAEGDGDRPAADSKEQQQPVGNNTPHTPAVVLQSSAEDSTDMFLNASNHAATAAIAHNTDENEDGELEGLLESMQEEE